MISLPDSPVEPPLPQDPVGWLEHRSKWAPFQADAAAPRNWQRLATLARQLRVTDWQELNLVAAMDEARKTVPHIEEALRARREEARKARNERQRLKALVRHRTGKNRRRV